MCRLFWYLGTSTSWNPQGLPRPVQGFLLLGQNPSLSAPMFLALSTVGSFVQLFLLADPSFLESVTRSTISLLWANCWIDCLQLRVKSHYSGGGRGGQSNYRIFSNLIRSNFYSFRGLKNQMRITIACGLDSRSRAGFWKNDGAAVRARKNNTIQ